MMEIQTKPSLFEILSQGARPAKQILETESSSEEEPIDTQDSIEGKKYNLYEDWTILKVLNHYKDINGAYGLQSPNLWNRLRYQRNLLNGTRSAMSMRNRYTKLKDQLDEIALKKIDDFVQKYGEEDIKSYYLKFKEGQLLSICHISARELNQRFGKKKGITESSAKKIEPEKYLKGTPIKEDDNKISTEKKTIKSTPNKDIMEEENDDDISNIPARELRFKKVKTKLFIMPT